VLVVVVIDGSLVLFSPSIPFNFLQVKLRASPLPLPLDADAMAKSKSTTTPTKASSSKTKDKDHTGGHRSSRANVSTRSASAQSSPSKRKADDHTDGSRSSKRRAVADSDATPQRAIPVRPARSKGKGKEVARSELELFKERHNSLFPRGVTVKRETPDAEPEPEPDADNIFVRPPLPIKPDDKEKLLDYVLLGTFGFEARQHAVDRLFEAARESTASKADFGVAYIEATVNRLKRKGIEEHRLTEILTMVQDGLFELVRAFVDSLGGPLSLPSPLSLPQDFGQAAARTMTGTSLNSVNGVYGSHSSRKSPVVVSHNGKQRSVRSESPSASSDSSSDDDEAVIPGSQKASRFRDDDDDEYIESISRDTRHHEHVKHEDGMKPFRSTRFHQPQTHKILLQTPLTAQQASTASMVRADVAESRSTILLALSSRRACLRPVTTS
jgi:hypothetical protein